MTAPAASAGASGGDISAKKKAVTRRHAEGATHSEAVYSACGSYRYALTREWGAGPRIVFAMLNPSTACERRNDPTVARCERRARAGGFGAMRVVNLFALRATDPRAMMAHPDPTGPGNDAVLEEAARWGDLLLCGWGVHGAHLGRGAAVAARLRAAGHALHVLGLTREGHPRHPLYVGYAQGPRPWTG